MSRIILGIDISSTTIGWGVLSDTDGELKLVQSGYIKPVKATPKPKKKKSKKVLKASTKPPKIIKQVSIFESLYQVKAEIKEIIDLYNPDEIAIEDLVQFMPKKSTAKTIITLAIYNRTVGLLCYELLKQKPNLYNVMSIRHKLKLDKQLPAKEEIPELIEKRLSIKFPWVTKVVKKKGVTSIERCEESFDVADGIAVAIYHAMTT